MPRLQIEALHLEKVTIQYEKSRHLYLRIIISCKTWHFLQNYRNPKSNRELSNGARVKSDPIWGAEMKTTRKTVKWQMSVTWGGNSAQEQVHSLTQRVGRWSSVVEHFIQHMGDPTLSPQHQETSKKTETQVWTQVMGITQILGPWY